MEMVSATKLRKNLFEYLNRITNEKLLSLKGTTNL